MNTHEPAEHDAPDSALEGQLRAYFSAQADPAPADLWQRLAPQLDATPTSATSSLRRAPTPLATLAHDDADADADMTWRRPHAPSVRRNRFTRGLASAASLVAMLALVLGAVALFHRAPGTGVVYKSGDLSWRKVAVPAGVLLPATTNYGPIVVRTMGHSSAPTPISPLVVYPNASLTVAPSNGDVAYICELPSRGAPKLWRTDDAGQQWTPLPALANDGYKSCGVLVDQNDPFTALVSFSKEAHPTPQSVYSTYALLDGVKQWQRLDGGPVADETLSHLASWHGDYYATITVSTATTLRSNLSVSTDHMQTWHAIDQQIITGDTLNPPGEYGEVGFWVNPTTGALLAVTYNSTRTGGQWLSVDHGANWREVVLPPSPISEVGETGSWVTGASLWVQQPAIGQEFRLCAWFSERGTAATTFYCSQDSGRTWTRRPAPQSGISLPAILLADGSILTQRYTGYYLNAGDATGLPASRFLGRNPFAGMISVISSGLGPTSRGVTFWQPADGHSEYVAQYTLPDM